MDLFRAPLRRSIVETQGYLLALRQPAVDCEVFPARRLAKNPLHYSDLQYA
jgi:hypothetical protein